jgi:hypothetical protein
VVDFRVTDLPLRLYKLILIVLLGENGDIDISFTIENYCIHLGCRTIGSRYHSSNPPVR